jgi:hypothetical protein
MMSLFSRRLVEASRLVLFLIVFTPLVAAAPKLTIEPLPKKIASGQFATLRLLLEWSSSEGPYEINSLEPKLENLTLEGQNQSQSISISEDPKLGQSQETGAIVQQTITYKFRPVKNGAALIYPFQISYRKSEGEPWAPILIPEQKATVVSGFPLKAILIGIGVLGALAVSGFAGFQAWQTLEAQKAARDIPPPDLKARIYGKAEESITTFNSPNSKEKLAHWSDQLRTVVAAYYDIPSRVKTSEETLSFLKAKGLPAGEWQEILRLFEQMNELQFSRQDIPSYDLGRAQKTLLQYVKGKIIIGNSNVR